MKASAMITIWILYDFFREYTGFGFFVYADIHEVKNWMIRHDGQWFDVNDGLDFAIVEDKEISVKEMIKQITRMAMLTK